MNFDDTVAAVSTPAGTGGISIIRISGADAVKIADKIFSSPTGKCLKDAATHTITHGYIKDENGAVLDEVLVSVMLAPHSYTAEDVVEINCHGGTVSTRKVLSAAVKSGARLAEAGEFTKRAFMNGRIDLCEAESVIDIINAKTSAAHEAGVNQLRGALSEQIDKIRDKLLTLTAHLQVLLDFAEEDLEPLTDRQYRDGLADAVRAIDALLATSLRGKVIRDGVKTAIVGKPNVGKSSLLNLLCGEERAIVTSVEGTTRDAIEESVSLGDIMLRITDTAGIRDTADEVESIGVERSERILADAELVIYMTDAGLPLDSNDRRILSSLDGKRAIALVNKAENGVKTDIDAIKAVVPEVIEFSVKERKGVDALEKTIEKMFDLGQISASGDAVIVDVRHTEALTRAKAALEDAADAIDSGTPPDMTFIDIENALSALGEITGQTVGEEIVDKIFHSFCVGK